MKNLNAVTLVRVSTKKQGGEDRFGMDAQRSSNARIVAEQGFTVRKTVEYDDVSGDAVMYTPEMQDLQEYLRTPAMKGGHLPESIQHIEVDSTRCVCCGHSKDTPGEVCVLCVPIVEDMQDEARRLRIRGRASWEARTNLRPAAPVHPEVVNLHYSRQELFNDTSHRLWPLRPTNRERSSRRKL